MFTFRKPGISANDLKSVFCFALALSPILLTAMAPETAAAQSWLPSSNQFAYVANQNANNVSGYKINAANGTWTPVAGSPFTTGTSGPASVHVSPDGRFLYVANQYAEDNDVVGFRIDGTTGKLTPVPGSPFTAGSGPTSIAIDPSGRFAYVANLGSNNVSAYTIDAISGLLIPVPGPPFPGGTFPAGSAPSSVTVDPLGKFVYVTNESSNNVSGYAIDTNTGALTPIAGSPFPAGLFPLSVAVDPNDRFAYVANQGSADITGYAIDPTTGALTALDTSPYAAGGGGVLSVKVDPTGGFVYLAGYGGVFAYTINQDSESIGPGNPFPELLYGQLTPVKGSPFGGGTRNDVAVDYTGTFLYAANKSSHDVSAYSLSSGVLKPIAASPFPSGMGPVSIALVRPRTIPLYAATEIPDPLLPAPVESITPAAINNLGEVTGSASTFFEPEPFLQAFVYAGGTSMGVAFSRTSQGYGINDRGQVVGQSYTQPPSSLQPPPQAFLYNYSTNSTIDIDTVPGRQSAAFSINNAGHITGSLSTVACLVPAPPSCPGETHAFLDNGGGLVDIGTLGGTFSQGTSINNLGEVAGVSSVAGSGLNHLFLYSHGDMHDLGTVRGESFNTAAINDQGEIVGSALNSSGVPASFIHRGNSFEKLPFLAGGLNDGGEIVGGNIVANGSSHAFLYVGGRSIDLNDLVEPSLPLLTYAAGISKNGKIVASGLNGHLYVLTPK